MEETSTLQDTKGEGVGSTAAKDTGRQLVQEIWPTGVLLRMCLSAVDTTWGRNLTVALQGKGRKDKYAVKMLEDFCRQLGFERAFSADRPRERSHRHVTAVCVKLTHFVPRDSGTKSKGSQGEVEIERRRPNTVSTGQAQVWRGGSFQTIPPSTWAMRHGNYLRRLFQRGTRDGKTPFFWHQHRDDGGQASLRQLSEGFSTRRGTSFSCCWRCEEHCGQREQACTKDDPEEKAQQPAGEEAATASSSNEPPKPPADERQGELAPATEQHNEVLAEEDAEMGTKGDQDRKRQEDDTMEQNNQSPPKRGVGRPVKKVLHMREERTLGCEGSRGESHQHNQARRLHQPTWKQVAKRVERDTLEETAQKKHRIEDAQRNKTARPGSSTDPDPDEPETKARRRDDTGRFGLHFDGRGHGHSRRRNVDGHRVQGRILW